FNPEKLLWINQQHMMKAPVEVLAAALRAQLKRMGIETSDQPLLEGVANAQRERAKTMAEMAQNSRFFFLPELTYDEKSVRKHLTPDTVPTLKTLATRLSSLASWAAPDIHAAISAVATESGAGLGKVAQPLRVGITGSAVSPPIDQTAALLGRERTLGRLGRAIELAAGRRAG